MLPGYRAAAADLSIAREFFETAVTVDPPQGTPPAAVVHGPDGDVLGFAFSTHDVSGSVGYSGRPLDIVAAISPEGVLAGARVVAQEEPILVIGIPREALAAYIASFKGFNVLAAARVRKFGRGDGPAAVAGATVTSAVIRDALLRSARAVLRSRSGEASENVRLDRETLRRLSWPALVGEGSVRRILLSRGDVTQRLGTRDAEPDKPYIDLWLALATPPAIGESLLGQHLYEAELAKMGPDDDLLFIGASGLYSFKGTEWRRSGIFDRIEIAQGEKTIRLHASDHTNVETLHAAGAPELREIGVFRIARASGFDPTRPFRLQLMLAAEAPPTASSIVSLSYRIPDRYLVSPVTRTVPASVERMPAAPPLWQDIWLARRVEIVVLTAMLAVLGGILIFQSAVTARSRFYLALRTGFLVMTFVFIGLVANAQLSVVNVLTFIHALLTGFRWELFLLDPVVFILWSFVAVSLLFWGRGVFCGWLCPFGALQELLNALAQRIGIRQITVPFGLHERLWMVKYVIFLGILGVSLTSIMAAFGMAEIEPFKTAITRKFARDWPFVLYAGSLLVMGLFIERFYCRYLCPLGAALAIPARMRMFEWLRRYRECGAECQVCARRCTVQAIMPLGQINPNECAYCLKCQANYFDPTVCLHLKKRAERRQPREVASTPVPAPKTAAQTGGRDAAP